MSGWSSRGRPVETSIIYEFTVEVETNEKAYDENTEQKLLAHVGVSGMFMDSEFGQLIQGVEVRVDE